jgi:hypothetical protein
MQYMMESRAPMPVFAVCLITAVALLGFSGSAQAKAMVPISDNHLPSPCSAIAGNLVTNCGFETGDFSGWTTTPAAVGSLFGVGDVNPDSGTYAAYFGATEVGSSDTISQSIPTAPGLTYILSFFIKDAGGSPAQFNAPPIVVNITSEPSPSYFFFGGSVVATGSSMTLSFSAYQVPSFFYLDDISVVAIQPVPAPMIGRGFPAFLCVGGLWLVVKLLERSNKRFSLGTAIPHKAA